MEAKKPNIILINADDLGYGDLGCYGSAVNDTPHIDRMAAEGLRFTDFYSAAPICSSSRGALMTGCYPRRIGFGMFDGNHVLFPGQRVGLNPNEITIAKLLKSAGYATMHIGKWHCGDQPEFLPTRHGFDSYYGLPFSNDMGRQCNRRENMLPPLPLLLDESVIEQQPDQAALTSRYTEQAVRFIRENKNGPFFLYLAHMHVHLPHYAPERFIKASRNGPFGAAVACMDWSCGVILRELAEQGLDEDTLVIFTSDNGARTTEGGSNAPLAGGKATTQEGGFRVPFIMRRPGHVPAGVCNGLVAAMDVYPTLANMAGAKIPTDRTIDGADFSPLLRGQPSGRDTFFYYMNDALCAVRNGKWKLAALRGNWTKCEPVNELYDLETDIGETDNVYEKHPEAVAALTALLEKCRADLGDSAAGKTGNDIRPSGCVDNPTTLTQYDPTHPYYMAIYDLPDAG
ncbi:MAG: sulfatase [Defluviitaleaceae bacterium]|nr:sulfatase [Defluviitaleaceae bacterium]